MKQKYTYYKRFVRNDPNGPLFDIYKAYNTGALHYWCAGMNEWIKITYRTCFDKNLEKISKEEAFLELLNK